LTRTSASTPSATRSSAPQDQAPRDSARPPLFLRLLPLRARTARDALFEGGPCAQGLRHHARNLRGRHLPGSPRRQRMSVLLHRHPTRLLPLRLLFLAHPRPTERLLRVPHHRQVGQPMRRVTGAVHRRADLKVAALAGIRAGTPRSGSQASTRGGSWTSYCAVELQECTQGRVGSADVRERDDACGHVNRGWQEPLVKGGKLVKRGTWREGVVRNEPSRCHICI